MFHFQGQDGIVILLQVIILAAVAVWLGMGVMLAIDRWNERRWRQQAERRGRRSMS